MAKIKLLPKQTRALDLLQDDSTNCVLFGGSVGSAKSFLGCTWIITNCFKYPKTRWLIGRSKLKNLRQTTLQTLFEVLSIMEIPSKYWNFNQQDNEIRFNNGSVIVLKDLFLYPSDPNFDSLGSLEITGAFIDECNQIVSKAWQIVRSRIRYRLRDYDMDGTPTSDLTPCKYNNEGLPIAWLRGDGSITSGLKIKMLGTCNPSKNWVYVDFYKPWKDGEEKNGNKFIQSLTKDNPYLSKEYIDSLMQLDKNSKERLLFGNWEYDDDPSKLIEYEKILDLWSNDFVESGRKYITCDIATKGSDRFVLIVWNGFRVIHIEAIEKNTGKDAVDKIQELSKRFQVPNSNIVYDADGVGAGLSGFIRGAHEFNNGSKAKNGENYNHIKSQVYFKMAEAINEGLVYIGVEDHKELITEELEQVKRDKVDQDGKLCLLPKKEVKERIGRSPDFSDALAMRWYFELTSGIQGIQANFF
jgi:hypothetical protein